MYQNFEESLQADHKSSAISRSEKIYEEGSMAKISLVKCENYNSEKVFAAVKRSVDLLGGIEHFVRPGTKVLLKPNLLSARVPEDAVDTHPEVVRAVVRLVRLAGAEPVIGDSPAGYGANIEDIFTKSGMRKVSEEEGVELIKLTSSKVVDEIPISRQILDYDCVISIPKFKTHVITVLTGAIKNMYGSVVGMHKPHLHSLAPKEKGFAKIVARIYSITRPELTVVDSVVAMEGDGPSGGVPREMKFVMAGSDGVAIDSCLAKIVGLNPLDILVTKEAYGMGAGEADLDLIEIAGDPLDDFIVKDFRLPQTTLLKFLPEVIVNGVATLLKFRPYINVSICARCNLCKITCPVSCISIGKDRCTIDYKKCIRCMCCHEICPYKAIFIKRSILTKLVWG